ncbi:MAG: hypothetical protein ACFB4I_07100 [Cyanophyceae cyanobacterium]
MLPVTFRFLLPPLLALAVMPSLQAQEVPSLEEPPEVSPSEELPTEDLSDPNNLRAPSQTDSLLSLQGGERLMTEAEVAINSQEYQLAASKLQKARQVFNQLTNFHLQLANSFSGIENRIYEAQRQSAAQTGQMRDEATYKLALVHRAQEQPELAVPLLIQVIRSQNPTSELGKKSYQQLYELGFVDSPYSTSGS